MALAARHELHRRLEAGDARVGLLPATRRSPIVERANIAVNGVVVAVWLIVIVVAIASGIAGLVA